MKHMTKEELLKVEGGLNFSAALINSIARIGGIILDFGRTVGTIIVRLKNGQICRL